MATKSKMAIEVLLAGADIEGIVLQPHLLKTTRLVTVDLLWPRCSIAKKTSYKTATAYDLTQVTGVGKLSAKR